MSEFTSYDAEENTILLGAIREILNDSFLSTTDVAVVQNLFNELDKSLSQGDELPEPWSWTTSDRVQTGLVGPAASSME